TPSVHAMYRFTARLKAGQQAILDAGIDRVIAALRRELPDLGRELAGDATDMSAWANGQRYLTKNGPERERYSDEDASWGHRSAVSTRKGGGYYGFKLHQDVCTRHEVPLAWEVRTGGDHESP